MEPNEHTDNAAQQDAVEPSAETNASPAETPEAQPETEPAEDETQQPEAETLGPFTLTEASTKPSHAIATVSASGGDSADPQTIDALNRVVELLSVSRFGMGFEVSRELIDNDPYLRNEAEQAAPPTRLTGAQLKQRQRQERRDRRLKERGY